MRSDVVRVFSVEYACITTAFYNSNFIHVFMVCVRKSHICIGFSRHFCVDPMGGGLTNLLAIY